MAVGRLEKGIAFGSAARRTVAGWGRRAGARASFELAWFVCLLCVALASGSLLLALLNGRTLDETFFEEGLITLAVLAATFCVVGALIASHRSGNSIGLIYCAATLCQGFSNSGFEYATYGLLIRLGSLSLVAETSWLAQWIWAPGLGLILVFVPLLFPEGRAPSRWWHPVAGLSVGLASVSGAIILWPERGQKYDVAKTLVSFSARLRDETDLETLGRDLVGVVGETVQPAHARL